jgi:DNA-binding NtrC family response regulator
MYIVLANTNRRGTGWALSDTPLTIGRGQGCDVRVLDPVVSRQHVHVWLENDRVRFEDSGASNAVLANGAPVHAGFLVEGDVLAVGSTLFRVTREAPVESAKSPGIAATPITLPVGRALYTQALRKQTLMKASPRNVNELHDLFQFGCALGALESITEFMELLRETLFAQFQPEKIWLALRYPDGPTLFFQDLDAEPNPPAKIAAMLERAIDLREGIVTPGVYKDGDEKRPETIMAVPMLHADQPLGGIILRGRAPARVHAEDDLHYAVAIAAMAAPHLRAIQHVEQLRRDHRVLLGETGTSLQLLGESPTMRTLRDNLRQAASTSLNVLLLGETGTGKEIAARLLHDWSSRAAGPFVVINCAAIPAELFESEFFGHERGAFTGAASTRVGRLEEANGGTLFLDEIGDLALDHQARILRALETGTFSRVGGTKAINVSVRFVAATNKPLETPLFRVDLLHRLRGIALNLPPLRTRTNDVPQLATHFLQLANQAVGHHKIHEIAPETLELLQRLPWPGNVRELRAAIYRAAAFSRRPTLTAEDFGFVTGADQNQDTSDAHFSDSLGAVPMLPLATIEQRHIKYVVQACQGNLTQAARVLGIARATLYKRIAE